jgi:hypothetical protein
MGHNCEPLFNFQCFVSNLFEIPTVWDDWLESATSQYESVLAKYETETLPAYEKKHTVWARSKGRNKGPEPTKPAIPLPRMQKQEDVNFLRFATSLKILFGSAITSSGLEKAEMLLQEYLLNFTVVRQLHCLQN